MKEQFFPKQDAYIINRAQLLDRVTKLAKETRDTRSLVKNQRLYYSKLGMIGDEFEYGLARIKRSLKKDLEAEGELKLAEDIIFIAENGVR